MTLKLPSSRALEEIRARLEKTSYPFALGGSGLMAAFGLVDEVRDWDITTDAPRPLVEKVCAGLIYQAIDPAPPFATDFLLRIELHGSLIDLMGGFSIEEGEGSEKRIVKISTEVTGEWRGFPLGSAKEWVKAYRLMKRHQKADLLEQYPRREISSRD